MASKKIGLTHSQVLGILWISIGLVLIVGAAVFLRKDGEEQPEAAENQVLNDTISQKMTPAQRADHDRRDGGSARRNARYKPLSDSAYSTMTPRKDRPPLMVEINSADTLTLQLLHGIGPAFAGRIVRYRDRLGGFVDKEQLLEVYGFTPELLDHISPHVCVDTTRLRRIAINSIGLKQLIKHPYIGYYQARDIVRLRNGGTAFTSADDLRAVPSMEDSTLERLSPYLDFARDKKEDTMQ